MSRVDDDLQSTMKQLQHFEEDNPIHGLDPFLMQVHPGLNCGKRWVDWV